MQTDQTPGQPQALQPDDAPPRPAPPQLGGLGAGECGDAIWDCPPAGGEAQGTEGTIQPGRIIDLVERQRRGGNAGR
jgi:hypothetical protein